MKLPAKTAEELFQAAGERGDDLRAVDSAVRAAAPQLERYVFGGMGSTMLGYGKYHYRYASSREGDWCVIGLAPQKNYLSLYVCMVRDGKYLPELYAERLGKVSVGKSCIRFKKLADLNMTAVEEIVAEAAELSKDPKNFQF
jgi:hypothetical protein